LKTKKNKWFKEGEVLASPEDFLGTPFIYATGLIMMNETLTVANLTSLSDKITGIQDGN